MVDMLVLPRVVELGEFQDIGTQYLDPFSASPGQRCPRKRSTDLDEHVRGGWGMLEVLPQFLKDPKASILD